MIRFRLGARSLAAAVPLVMSLGPAPAAAGPPGVPWRVGAESVPAASATQWEEVAARAHQGERHVVVQFDAIPDRAQRAALAARGLRVLRSIGGGAYFAVLAPDTVALERLDATPGIAGLETVRGAWKLHPALAAGVVPAWAVVEPDGPDGRWIAAYVVLHADVDLPAGADLLESQGVRIRNALWSINGLVVELAEVDVSVIAGLDAVQWIEPPLPPLSVTNDGVRARTQAADVQAPPYDLDGTGVTVLVYDGGSARATHADFEGRLTVLDSSPTITHATHVAGTIGGAGIANPAYVGMAPGVTLLSYGLEGVTSAGPLYTDPGDLETDFADAINAGGAVLANASLGSNVEMNGFDCAWQGDYGVTDALIDAIVAGRFGAPFRSVWAGGNERTGHRCDVEGFGEYYSIAPPAGAKNHLTVGAVNSDDDSMTDFSSWGPTDDGRLKPDVCAPGCQNGGDYGVTSCSAYSDTSYASACGSSMAAPAVCGLAALVLQDFQAHYPGQPLPTNALLRALFAHTAVDLGNAGPDYAFGYGSVRVRDALDLLRTGRFGENVVDQGEAYTRTIVVEPGDPELRVTLAWDDVPGVPNVAVALVNDLDLVVTGPDGTRCYPWTLDPLAPASPAVRTQADHVNNIEQVLVENPAPGAWTIAVVGHHVPEGPQTFALVGDGPQNVVAVITLPDGLPDVVAPGAAWELDVRMIAYGQELVPGSARLHYRADGGAFAELPLTALPDDLYRATLPPCACGGQPEYYLAVETTIEGTVTLPSGAPEELLTHAVGAWTPLVTEDFEQPGDWTVLAGAVAGNWERADPQQVVNLGVVTQPEDDHTPGDGHLCYVTGPLAGLHASAHDVDGGPSHLVSPVYDLAGRDAVVSYWRWYHISVSMDDPLVVAVSADGLTWVPVEEVRRSAEEWVYREWRVRDYITPSATVQVRFTVNDTDPGSLMEAAVDDFGIRHVTCTTPPVPGDLDGDGDVDADDYARMESCLAGPGAAPTAACEVADLAMDGDVDLVDFAQFQTAYGAAPALPGGRAVPEGAR